MATFKKIQPYWVVFSAGLFFLFEYINMNSFDVFNADLRQSFNVNAWQISNLSAMYFYANMLFLIPAGLLLDRCSTKRLLQMALVLCILGNLVFASTHSFEVAKLCRFVIGIGSTLVLLAPALLTARWIIPKHAGLVIGLVVTMAMLGGSIAQQLPYLSDHLGSWRSTVVAIAVLGGIFLLWISIFVKDYPATFEATLLHNRKLIEEGFAKNALQVLKCKQMWLAGLYTSLIDLTIMVVGALWGSDYLQAVHQLSAKQASFVITMIFMGMMIGCPLFGLISDRLGRRKSPMLIGGALNLICILIILYCPLSYGGLIALFLILGILCASQILTYPLIMESVPSHLIGASESVSAVLIMGSPALFQSLFGYILLRSNFKAAMLMLPIAFLMAMVLACFLKETYCKRIGE